MRSRVLELAFLVGLGAVVNGVYALHPAAGWIIGGLIVSGCAVIIEMNGKVEDEAIPNSGGPVPARDSANPKA